PCARWMRAAPWWLVALRMLIAGLVIAGLAEPLWNAQGLKDSGPVVIVLDDGWAAAHRWPDRVAAAREIIEGADLRRRPVALVTTAATPTASAGPLAATDARDALARLNQLEPKPWSADQAQTTNSLAQLALDSAAEVFWISDGIAQTQSDALTAQLQRLGPVKVLELASAEGVLILDRPERSAGEGGTSAIALKLKRLAKSNARPAVALTVRAMDASGAVVADTKAEFAAGSDLAKAAMTLPTELANRIARFDVAGHASAAATALADDRWQQRPVGIYSVSAEGTTAPLLEDGFYLGEALNGAADVRVGNVRDLLSRPLSMLIVSGGQRLAEDEAQTLSEWVDQGGMLVRFAGPRLDAAGDRLLPVALRATGRNLGGALSWGEPAGLGPFPEASPFKALAVPDDVRVKTQILAEPKPDLPEKTWARLNDGTPLITAERRGAGWIVLFHVTATPEWSNLPLSGLFVNMLGRLLDLSQGVTDVALDTPDVLPPLTLLDGLGRAMPPGPLSPTLKAETFAQTFASATAPPGLYGTAAAKLALNLGPAVWSATLIDSWPAGVTRQSIDQVARERDLKPWVLLAALLLLLADVVIGFALRGLLPRMPKLAGRTAAAVMCGVIGFAALHESKAAETNTRPLDPAMTEAILQTRLAYVKSGASEVDRVAQNGLEALTRVLAARTSAEMGAPSALDLAVEVDADALMPYPLLYWRVTPGQELPPGKTAEAVNEYLHHGGMIVFDAPDQVGALGTESGSEGGSAGGRLREILARLDIPPLMTLNDDHVLTRSFYLLPGLPGRYANSTVYVERGSSANDGVSSVIIGGNDWAAAWARDASGLPLYPMVPGGEQQREASYRAGVNMVMYALTGNYKEDQVHLPAIMQRLTQ
ncbi:MAG: DUF4159 domain-containing protein, partial [Rhodospirillaceae bacterium]|nr:DUF4159 domain-containing protein [Rhodospirillaceae bacterium]